MRRARLAAVTGAAVLGVLGGTAAGLDLVGTDVLSTDPAREEAPGSGEEQEPPLLYLAGGEIHDGDGVLRLASGGQLARQVRSREPTVLTRRDGGYLVAVKSSGPAAPVGREDLWSVAADGSELLLGRVSAGWDQDEQGTRVVGHDLTEDRLTVWDATTGEALARWDGAIGERDSAAYDGEEVLVSTRRSPTSYDLRRWDVATGTTTTDPLGGYDQMAASPDGELVAGPVSADGLPADIEAFCLQLHQSDVDDPEVRWQTCDWRSPTGRPVFSPDGSRLLVVPSATEGLGPSELAVIDVERGPDPLEARFDTPENTGTVARWSGDDAVLVVVLDYVRGGPSTSVQRCTLEGDCAEVVTPREGPFVLGENR